MTVFGILMSLLAIGIIVVAIWVVVIGMVIWSAYVDHKWETKNG